MPKEEKGKLILTEHSKVGLFAILSNVVWWIISTNSDSAKFKLFFGLLTLILTLIASYIASTQYKSETQKQFTQSSTLSMTWVILITMLVENCFFDFQSPQRLILSFILGSFAFIALFADAFTQVRLYKTLFLVRDINNEKPWSSEMKVSVVLTSSIPQIIALYTLIRYPFISQFSWENYPDQYYYLVNAWHLVVSIMLTILPVYSLYNVGKIGQNFVNSYVRATILLPILFCVTCIYLRVKWFY